MPDHLIIFDTTLRDGEQSPGASMTNEEKMRIAKQLERLKVDVIEAGFPASSNGDFAAVKAIANAIKDSPEVQGIIHMRTEHIGPDELLVGVKVGFEPSMSIRDLADAINGVERRMRAAVPEATVIYIEPDVLRGVDEFPEIDVPQDVDEALP